MDAKIPKKPKVKMLEGLEARVKRFEMPRTFARKRGVNPEACGRGLECPDIRSISNGEARREMKSHLRMAWETAEPELRTPNDLTRPPFFAPDPLGRWLQTLAWQRWERKRFNGKKPFCGSLGVKATWLAAILGLSLVSSGWCQSAHFLELKAHAEKGDSEAQWNLGVYYEAGEIEVTKDLKEAIRWYRKSAWGGNRIGQFRLARCYEEGVGVPRDYVAAVAWYRKSAEEGYNVAQFWLGSCYREGRGVPRDYVDAYKWLSISAVSGLRIAKDNLDRIEKEMSPEQIAEAQRRSSEFKPAMQAR